MKSFVLSSGGYNVGVPFSFPKKGKEVFIKNRFFPRIDRFIGVGLCAFLVFIKNKKEIFMKRNFKLLLICAVLAVSLVACDTAEENSDVLQGESEIPEVSINLDNESKAENEVSETSNDLVINKQYSDTLKMSIDFSLVSEDIAVTALEVEETYDSFDKGKHSSEYEAWSIENRKPFDNTNAPRDAVISFFGKSVNCKYENSQLDIYSNSPSDIYKGKTEDGDTVEFELHPETGEVVDFFNFSTDQGNVSVEEATKTANQIASAYINIEDYEFYIDSNEIIHNFRYTKKIGEYATAEILKIGISTDGQLTYFHQNMINTFDLTDEESAAVEARLDKLSLPNAKNVLEEKIASIYPDYSEYEVYYATATVLDDGSIAMVYNLGVSWLDEFVDENGETAYGTGGSREFIIIK